MSVFAGTLCLPPPRLCQSSAPVRWTLVCITAEFSCPGSSTTRHPPFIWPSQTAGSVGHKRTAMQNSPAQQFCVFWMAQISPWRTWLLCYFMHLRIFLWTFCHLTGFTSGSGEVASGNSTVPVVARVQVTFKGIKIKNCSPDICGRLFPFFWLNKSFAQKHQSTYTAQW